MRLNAHDCRQQAGSRQAAGRQQAGSRQAAGRQQAAADSSSSSCRQYQPAAPARVGVCVCVCA
jgi:hypothetical protein